MRIRRGLSGIVFEWMFCILHGILWVHSSLSCRADSACGWLARMNQLKIGHSVMGGERHQGTGSKDAVPDSGAITRNSSEMYSPKFEMLCRDMYLQSSVIWPLLGLSCVLLMYILAPRGELENPNVQYAPGGSVEQVISSKIQYIEKRVNGMTCCCVGDF